MFILIITTITIFMLSFLNYYPITITSFPPPFTLPIPTHPCQPPPPPLPVPTPPRPTPPPRRCPSAREYIDGKMLALAEAEKVSLARRKTPAAKEDVRDEGAKGGPEGGEESCQAPPTPSCCACRDAGVSGSEDQEVMGQIAFEDFIMDNVYVKK